MKSLAMLAVTSNLSDPADRSAISVTGMTRMDGTPIPHQNGEAGITFMRQFDYIVFWHWIPPWLVRELQACGTECIIALDIEAVKTYPEWHPHNETLRKAFTWPPVSLMNGSSYNRFGHPYIDIYEMSVGPWNQKPHAWAVDVGSRLGIEIFKMRLSEIMAGYQGNTKPRGFFIDSMHDHYYGTATNANGVSRAVNWEPYTSMISGLFGPVWGHTGEGWRTIDEWSLRDKPPSQIAHDLFDADRNNLLLCLAPNNGPSDMEKLEAVRDRGASVEIFQTARSGMWATMDVEHYL